MPDPPTVPDLPNEKALKPKKSAMANPSSRLSVTEQSLAGSPSLGAQKGVTIFDEPEHIEPEVHHDEIGTPSTLVGSHSPKLHRASITGKKMIGRPPLVPSASSTSIKDQISFFSLDHNRSTPEIMDSKTVDPKAILSQVVDWLHEEQNKRQNRSQHDRTSQSQNDEEAPGSSEGQPEKSVQREHDLALHKLESILSGFTTSGILSASRSSHKLSNLARRGSIAKIFKKNSNVPASSDTEYFGDDVLVPNVEAKLDNSKTMAFTGGSAHSDTSEAAKRRDHEHWVKFKEDILRLTHTLKLKGWRRIPMERAGEIDVSRLSGALTNAVYVVKPPKQIQNTQTNGSLAPIIQKRNATQLLLRIYGPQVEHLIDRDAELHILRRLARKRIGPRLLGSFTNGRFEEYLHAETLTAEDIRVPETSKQIAKRMRELHDGIELLESEFSAGPAIFLNWDKWVDRCEKVMTWLDQQVHNLESGKGCTSKPQYTRRGLVCGVDWPIFRKAYDRYRTRLVTESGGVLGLKKKLVFAHNDTQYGNLMRLRPSGESPLLQPSNHHKQLVVIDFEYASQNTIGLEFVNHFTEWCYNYHHPDLSYACNTTMYPTLPEQYRFVRSYVMHRPQFNPAASATPKMEGREKTNISDFMLDARTPQGATSIDYDEEEREREKATEDDIQKLLHETRLWRIANSASWVAWGIVQAKVPEVDEDSKKTRIESLKEAVKQKLHPQSDTPDEDIKQHQQDAKHDRPEGREQEEAHAEGDEDESLEFDYLGYAHDRAMFFWGDCLQMGIVKEEELPENLLKAVKIVKY